MNSLPTEIVRSILFIAVDYATPLRHVCRKWAAECPNEPRRNIIRVITEHGSVTLLKWALSVGYAADLTLLDTITETKQPGKMHRVMLLHRQLNINPLAQIPTATLIGARNLSLLRYAHATGQFIPSRIISIHAARQGHFAILAWLNSKKMPMSRNLLNQASHHGLEMVRCVRKIIKQTPKHTFCKPSFKVATQCSIDIAEYLLDEKYPVDTPKSLGNIIKYGDLDIVSRVLSTWSGQLDTANLIRSAIKNYRSEILVAICEKYGNINGFSNDKLHDIIEICAKFRNLSAIKYLCRITGAQYVISGRIASCGVEGLEWAETVQGPLSDPLVAFRFAARFHDIAAMEWIEQHHGQFQFVELSKIILYKLPNRKRPLDLSDKTKMTFFNPTPAEYIKIIDHCHAKGWLNLSILLTECSIYAHHYDVVSHVHDLHCAHHGIDKLRIHEYRTIVKGCAATNHASDTISWLRRKCPNDALAILRNCMPSLLRYCDTFEAAAIFRHDIMPRSPREIYELFRQSIRYCNFAALEHLCEIYPHCLGANLWNSRKYPELLNLLKTPGGRDMIDWAISRKFKIGPEWVSHASAESADAIKREWRRYAETSRYQ